MGSDLTCVGHSRCYEFIQQAVWDRAAIFVVAGHPPERLFLPNPVLQHLRRHLHKVCLHLRPTELCIARLEHAGWHRKAHLVPPVLLLIDLRFSFSVVSDIWTLDLYVWEYWRTREQSSCMICPNSWKKVSTSWCCSKEGQLRVGFVKLDTMAATGILRFPSGRRHPGWSPKHAAWPYLPSLKSKTDQCIWRSLHPRPISQFLREAHEVFIRFHLHALKRLRTALGCFKLTNLV